MCEQDYENKKLVITKFSVFLQTLNSNFRLSANRALLFSYLTITDVTSYVHHKLPVSFLHRNQKHLSNQPNQYCKQFHECSYLRDL